MRLRDQVGAQQVSDGEGVDLVRLHLRGADGFQLLRVREDQINSVATQQVRKPVPAAGGLHHGAMGSGQAAEVIEHRGRRSTQAALFNERPSGIHGADGGDRACGDRCQRAT